MSNEGRSALNRPTLPALPLRGNSELRTNNGTIDLLSQFQIWSNRQSKTWFSRKFPSPDHHTWSNCAQKPSKDELYIATAANHHQTHHQRRPIRTSINLHFYLYKRAANPQKVCYFRSLNPPPLYTHPNIISLESPASTRHNQACRRVPSGAVSVNPRSNNVTIKRSILEIGRF